MFHLVFYLAINALLIMVIGGIMNIVFCDKHGWPVERVIGRPIQNFLRLLIHTRKIKRVDSDD